jgi:hypothetical protein
MLPSIAFPYRDPSLQMFPHLQAILPDLKGHFLTGVYLPANRYPPADSSDGLVCH